MPLSRRARAALMHFKSNPHEDPLGSGFNSFCHHCFEFFGWLGCVPSLSGETIQGSAGLGTGKVPIFPLKGIQAEQDDRPIHAIPPRLLISLTGALRSRLRDRHQGLCG